MVQTWPTNIKNQNRTGRAILKCTSSRCSLAKSIQFSCSLTSSFFLTHCLNAWIILCQTLENYLSNGPPLSHGWQIILRLAGEKRELMYLLIMYDLLNEFQFRMDYDQIYIYIFISCLKVPNAEKRNKFSQQKEFLGMDCWVFLIKFQPVKRLHVSKPIWPNALISQIPINYVTRRVTYKHIWTINYLPHLKVLLKAVQIKYI